LGGLISGVFRNIHIYVLHSREPPKHHSQVANKKKLVGQKFMDLFIETVAMRIRLMVKHYSAAVKKSPMWLVGKVVVQLPKLRTCPFERSAWLFLDLLFGFENDIF
jgi:hypothetical protein